MSFQPPAILNHLSASVCPTVLSLKFFLLCGFLFLHLFFFFSSSSVFVPSFKIFPHLLSVCFFSSSSLQPSAVWLKFSFFFLRAPNMPPEMNTVCISTLRGHNGNQTIGHESCTAELSYEWILKRDEAVPPKSFSIKGYSGKGILQLTEFGG